MEAEVEGVDVWRCVSLPAGLEGVGWTVELAACGISAPRDLIGEDALERAPRSSPRPKDPGGIKHTDGHVYRLSFKPLPLTYA